jgi:DNA topoisomerase-1
MFNPMVQKLSLELKDKKKEKIEDEILGIHPENNKEIFIGDGKYGPYIKILNNDKWNYVSIKEIENITLDKAVELLKYPKLLGKIVNKKVYLNNGSFGYYIKYGTENISIKNYDQNEIDLKIAKELITEHENNKEKKIDKNIIKSFTIKDKVINVKNGMYGAYIQLKNKNIPIPKNIDVNTIDLKQVLEILGK